MTSSPPRLPLYGPHGWLPFRDPAGGLGVADNKMLNAIIDDVAMYTSVNR